MDKDSSVYAPNLREAGFIPMYTIPVTELFSIAGAVAPTLPLQPIFFWKEEGESTATIAVDELGYQWVALGEHIDLSTLGFRDTSSLIPQLHLEHDAKKKN